MITYLIIGLTVITSWQCFNNRELFMKLALMPYRVSHRNEWYRVFTHAFVHADMTHLLVNMITFWSFGTFIEQYFTLIGLGKMSYLFLYIGGLIVASTYDLIRQKNNDYYVSVGASGAVSAILFSYILVNPLGMIYFFMVLPVPALLFGVLYLVYCQAMAKRGGGNINHNAHFYGAIFGLIFPLLLRPSLIQVFLNGLKIF